MTNQVEEKICKYCEQKVMHKMPFGNGLVSLSAVVVPLFSAIKMA